MLQGPQYQEEEEVVVFALDPEKKEIFSKMPHLEAIEEIRVPITEQSLAGFAAKYLRPVNIGDAYNQKELSGINPSLVHDSAWDKKNRILDQASPHLPYRRGQ